LYNRLKEYAGDKLEHDEPAGAQPGDE
jgi:hypothetical protein